MPSVKNLWPSVGLFVCAILLAGCSKKEPLPEPVRAVKLIEVGQVARHEVAEYAGDVRAQTESRLGFQVAGKLQSRSVNVGDVVKAGQVLAQMDAQDYALAMQAAQAQVAAAKTQRDLAQADWKRFSALKDQGFISGVELDRRHASLQAAQAQLEQAQAQAMVQKNQTAYTQLKASHAGVVTAVMAEPGQVVSAGAPVVQLAHDGARDAVVSVPENALASVPVGQKVAVHALASQQKLEATVREVAASAEAATRTYQVKVALDGGAQLPLGSTVSVFVQAPSAEAAALKLPSTAVWQHAGQSTVWVFDAKTSTVHAQAVEISGVDGNEMVVASGLSAGMQVVSAGTHVLNEGQHVMVYQPKFPESAQ